MLDIQSFSFGRLIFASKNRAASLVVDHALLNNNMMAQYQCKLIIVNFEFKNTIDKVQRLRNGIKSCKNESIGYLVGKEALQQAFCDFVTHFIVNLR